MVAKANEIAKRILSFPRDQTEREWLDAFEYLRAILSDSLEAYAHLGSYRICDFPGFANASGCVRIHARTPVPGIESDSWEGVLSWSGNRGEVARATALIFPFFGGSVVQPGAQSADDLGFETEVRRFLLYQFQGGEFVNSGWQNSADSGEWAGVKVPGSVYFRDLPVYLPITTFCTGVPIFVDFTIPDTCMVRGVESTDERISLIHVNRNRENTNLVPWSASPPTDSRYTQSCSDCSLQSPDRLRIRLDRFNIRGGWKPGNYYMSLRIQNFHDSSHWAWSSEISKPFKLKVV